MLRRELLSSPSKKRAAAAGVRRSQNFSRNKTALCAFKGQSCVELYMLTLLAMLAGPILVTTVVLIVVFEIKDIWDKNRLS
jgi:hypothetical protein